MSMTRAVSTTVTAPPSPPAPPASTDHPLFLAALPGVTAVAHQRFAGLPASERAERVAEAIASGFLMYLSLVRRGRGDQVCTLGFAINAARAAAGGRQVGSGQNGRDVLSPLGRCKHRRPVLSFDGGGAPPHERGPWLHEAIADRRTPIPEQVALRVDGSRWLATLPGRDRAMVKALAAGERAVAVARRFGLSAARLSQLWRRWASQWQAQVGIAA